MMGGLCETHGLPDDRPWHWSDDLPGALILLGLLCWIIGA